MNAEHADLTDLGSRFAVPAERDLPAGRRDLHREVLMNHMLTEKEQGEPAARHRRRSRRRIMAIGGPVVLGIAAATVVATLIATPATPPPARSFPGGHATLPAATSPLTGLAAYIIANSRKQPGNATLVLSHYTYTTGQAPASNAGLYADSGAYYWAPTVSGLAGQVAAHHNLGDGQFAREIAAAEYAVHGDLAIARERMAGLSGPADAGMSAAAIAVKAEELGVHAAHRQSLAAAVNKALTDGDVWENCLDTFVSGAGNPHVRAGLLRLLSTVSGISVTNGTLDGQSTLVVAHLMAGANAGIQYQEALVLGARTAIPVKFTGGAVGKTPDVTITYKISRVTVADGKF